MARRKPRSRPARGRGELDFDEVTEDGIVRAGLGNAAQHVCPAGDMHSALNGKWGFGKNEGAAFADFFEVAGDGFGDTGAVDADNGH